MSMKTAVIGKSAGWELVPTPKMSLSAICIFHNHNSPNSHQVSQESRQACLVIPVPPGRGGNGYIWLEGKEADLQQFGDDFFKVLVGQSKSENYLRYQNRSKAHYQNLSKT